MQIVGAFFGLSGFARYPESVLQGASSLSIGGEFWTLRALPPCARTFRPRTGSFSGHRSAPDDHESVHDMSTVFEGLTSPETGRGTLSVRTEFDGDRLPITAKPGGSVTRPSARQAATALSGVKPRALCFEFNIMNAA